jgi:hypothetical protein
MSFGGLGRIEHRQNDAERKSNKVLALDYQRNLAAFFRETATPRATVFTDFSSVFNFDDSDVNPVDLTGPKRQKINCFVNFISSKRRSALEAFIKTPSGYPPHSRATAFHSSAIAQFFSVLAFWSASSRRRVLVIFVM